jgi:electron transport complex protein RnfG
MKRMIIIGGKLAVICAIAAYVLAMVNAFTAPRIAENREKALADALQNIAGSGRVGEHLPVSAGDGEEALPAVTGYYPVYAAGSQVVNGYILQLTGSGYGGEMDLLARYALDGTVLSAVLMENQESPGLGKKAEDPEYMEKFIQTGGDDPIPVRKDMLPSDEADGVTGSTVTFVGIARALKRGSEYVRTLDEN